MARPEILAAIGLRLQYLQEGIRSSLLTNIYSLILPHLDEDEIDNFSAFYQEMLFGISEEARERGQVQKTLEELEAYIMEMGDLPGMVQKICMTLIERMKPPPPMEL